MKFKVGDRVKFVGDSWFINVGDVGVILEVESQSNPYNIDFGRDNKLSREMGDDVWSCAEDELECVKCK